MIMDERGENQLINCLLKHQSPHVVNVIVVLQPQMNFLELVRRSHRSRAADPAEVVA